jgi:hypothetical protein
MPIGSIQLIGMWKQFTVAVKNVVEATADLRGMRQDVTGGSRASTHQAHLSNVSKPPTGVNNISKNPLDQSNT